jgi:hypothetical protein
MRKAIRHMAILLVAALGACEKSGSALQELTPSEGNQGAGVQVSTDRAAYAQGALVGLTIVNAEPDRLYYHPCMRKLEVREGPSWVAGPESLRLCDKRAYSVAAGTRLRDSTDLDIGLVPGEYRIVLDFVREAGSEGESIRGVTNSFVVEP